MRGARAHHHRRGWLRAALFGFVLVVTLAGAAGSATSTVRPRSPEKAALKRLRADSVRPLEVRRSGDGAPYFVTGRIPVASFSASGRAVDRGRDFWRAYGAAFGVSDPAAELRLRSVETDELGMTHVRYDQRYRGLPVFGRQLVLHFDREAVNVVNGDFEPAIEVPRVAGISAAAAAETARSRLAKHGARPSKTAPKLVVFVEAGRAHLAWEVSVSTRRPFGWWRVFVDAREGDVVASYNELHTAKNRNTYTNGNDLDCNNQIFPACILPGALRRSELACFITCDAVVNAAHDHAGTVYDYFSTTFGRDSYDGAGHAIRSTVHFGLGFNNAFWCPDDCAADFGSAVDGEQMVYGDGDGVVFAPLSQGLDVVAHELTHAVTDSEARLVYVGQSGALNESYSDVFAAMVDAGDWLIGEDVVTPGTAGDALRSMSDPALFGQPAHMSAYVNTLYDNGGVHVNSGIPNKAAHLVAEGVGYGIGRADTQRIYYRALTVYLTPTSDFMANLNALRQSAIDLFGAGSPQVRAVERAHAAVGLANRPQVTFPNGGEALNGGVGTTVTWTAGDMGLQFAVDELRDLGTGTYRQSFESSTLPPEFSTGGNAAWFADAFQPGAGTRSAGSGVIGHDQRSELSLTRRMRAAGSVTFKARVSSEKDFDFFSFHVDGVPKLVGSGSIPWQTVSVSVPAGTHTFTWVYEKDFTVSAGFDRAWIDDVVVPNAELVSVTPINPMTAAGATSQAWTPPSVSGADFRVRVRAVGIAPWLAADDSDGLFTVVPPNAVSIGNADVVEGDASALVFTVSRANPAGDSSVGFSTADGAAKVAVDYTAASGTVAFAAGETSKTVTVPVLGDALDESNETMSLLLIGGTNVAVVDGAATGTILDDDPAPTLRVNNVGITEGNSGTKTVKFTVRLSAVSGKTVTVRYATANGTARASRDYNAKSGTLTFFPGRTAKTVGVAVRGDLLNEANETFFLKLSSPVNATFADRVGRATIVDND